MHMQSFNSLESETVEWISLIFCIVAVDTGNICQSVIMDVHHLLWCQELQYADHVDSLDRMTVSHLITCSHHRHQRDKTVWSCLVTSCVRTPDKTVFSCLDPVFNLQLIDCSQRRHGQDKRLSDLVCSCVHTVSATRLDSCVSSMSVV